MTNGDKIRQMSNEELSKSEMLFCKHCIWLENCRMGGTQSCEEGTLKWLEMEAEQ